MPIGCRLPRVSLASQGLSVSSRLSHAVAVPSLLVTLDERGTLEVNHWRFSSKMSPSLTTTPRLPAQRYSGNYETVSDEVHFSIELRRRASDADADAMAIDWIWCGALRAMRPLTKELSHVRTIWLTHRSCSGRCPPRCELAGPRTKRLVENLARASGCRDRVTTGDGLAYCLGLPEPKLLQRVLRHTGFAALVFCASRGRALDTRSGGYVDADCPPAEVLRAAWSPGVFSWLVPLEYMQVRYQTGRRQPLYPALPLGLPSIGVYTILLTASFFGFTE